MAPMRIRGVLPIAVTVVMAVAWASPAAAVECWRGWGYWVDGTSRAYKSGEMLLVTRGPANWAPGAAVTLYTLDRATGRLDPEVPPIAAIPLNPRTYYRGNLNYADGLADVRGSTDRLVFGLSHIAPPSAPIGKLDEYNAWVCGLDGAAPAGE